VHLDPRRNRTQLPILAGGWPVLLVGLDLSGADTVSDRTCGLVRYPLLDGQVRLCAAQRGQGADRSVTIGPDISFPRGSSATWSSSAAPRRATEQACRVGRAAGDPGDPAADAVGGCCPFWQGVGRCWSLGWIWAVSALYLTGRVDPFATRARGNRPRPWSCPHRGQHLPGLRFHPRLL